MNVTVNLNHANMEYVRSSGLSVDEFINSLIAKHIQEETKAADEENFRLFLQSLDEFPDDFMKDGRVNDPPQKRGNL